jgi:hypothetical protein
MWNKRLLWLTLAEMGRILLWLIFGTLVWLGLWHQLGGL